MNGFESRRLCTRRRLLKAAGVVALTPWLPARAADRVLPEIPALSAFLAGRSPRWERVHLVLPALADNGHVVPMKIAVDGPFAPGPHVSAIHLFSPGNPVPEMAVFEFPVLLERIEVESRVRLADSQRLVAVVAMSDGALLTAVADVIVTLAGCLDGT